MYTFSFTPVPLSAKKRLHNCHLRAVAGAGDGCHDVSAKCRPGLKECAVFRAYLDAGAVSGEASDDGFGNHAFLFLKHCAAFLRESVFLETALRFIRDGQFDKTCFYRWFQIPFFKVCAPF
jgi:hypothetical protein